MSAVVDGSLAEKNKAPQFILLSSVSDNADDNAVLLTIGSSEILESQNEVTEQESHVRSIDSEEVHYYDNCRGCTTHRMKEAQKGVPYKYLAFIGFCCLSNSLPIASLFPFLYFMIRDLHIAKRVEDIGIYAGILGSSYMIGRALTSTLWGMAADRYGRKPILMTGTISVFILSTVFGLSSNYWMALVTRFILGGLSCVLGTMKAYASEICNKEYRGLGQGMVSAARGMGLVFGPAIGGFLAQPAVKYPHSFSKDSLFGRYPYFLPCFAISILSACAFVVCFWLPETLHKHPKENDATPPYGSDEGEAVRETEENEPSSTDDSLLKNWPLMSTIIIYCVFSLHEMAYSEIFSLWAVSDKNDGGLSFKSQAVGVVLAISGCGLLIFQLFVFSPLERRLGPIMVTRVLAILTIPLTQSLPFIARLSGLTRYLILIFVCTLKISFSMSTVTGLAVLQNAAVPQHKRAAANGISMTLMSISKAFGPAGGGVLFSWSQKRLNASFLPGAHLIFSILNIITFIGFLMTFEPFLPPCRKFVNG